METKNPIWRSPRCQLGLSLVLLGALLYIGVTTAQSASNAVTYYRELEALPASETVDASGANFHMTMIAFAAAGVLWISVFILLIRKLIGEVRSLIKAR